MSTTLETSALASQGDHERPVQHEEEIAAIREQLDERLLAPYLTDEQRTSIVQGAVDSIDRLRQEDVYLWGGAPAIQEMIGTQEWLANVANPDIEYSGSITPQYANALKYFSGALFDQIRSLEAAGELEAAEEVTHLVRSTFFSSSPNITSYVGGLSDRVELLSYANRSSLTQSLVPGMSGEIIYNGANTPFHLEVMEAISDNNRTPIAQLEYIDVVTQLALDAPNYGAWANNFAEEAAIGLEVIAGGQGNCTPFVRLAAYNSSAEASLGPHPGQRVPEDKMQEIFDDSSLSENDKALLRVMYRPNMLATIEQQLSVGVSELSREAQLRLVAFMTEADSERYERLTKALSMAGKGRQQLAEAFLATEFGDDYGDAILSIAENAPKEQAGEVFEVVNAFREHSARLSGWYKDYDPEFAAAAERAMNERLTDALYAVEELARTGELAVDVAPHRGNEDYENDGRFMTETSSVKEGIDILKNLEHSLALQHEIITSPDVEITRVTADKQSPFAMYRFSSEKHGDALLYVRPEGASAYDRNFEYGNHAGVEASISFIVNPTNPHHLRSDKDPHGVSIRFDREGRLPDESPFSDERSPIREEGSISLDISSGLGDSKNMPVKIGRLIAAGNLLRAQKVGSKESLHHNTNYFDQKKYGSADGFRELAEYVSRMAEAMITIQKRQGHLVLPRQNTPEDLPKAA